MGKWFTRPLTQTHTNTHSNIVTINGNNGNSFGSWERTFAIFALVKMGFQCFSAVGCVHMICCFLNVEAVFPRTALMVVRDEMLLQMLFHFTHHALRSILSAD